MRLPQGNLQKFTEWHRSKENTVFLRFGLFPKASHEEGKTILSFFLRIIFIWECCILTDRLYYQMARMEIEMQETFLPHRKSDRLGAMMRQIILSTYILFNLFLRQGMGVEEWRGNMYSLCNFSTNSRDKAMQENM